MRSLFEESGVRLQFAGHETFPLRYGWLKKAYDAIRADLNQGSRSIFSSEGAIGALGVGKNMVASMRHWGLASGILAVEDEKQPGTGRIVTAPLGDLLLGADPYLEAPGSLWLIHWHLAAMPGRAATWYFAFNEFNEPVFGRELLRQRLARRCDELRDTGRLREARITETTLKRDVDCFVRTYAARPAAGGRASFEEGGLESPLTELALLQPVDVTGAFQFRRGPKSSLPDEVFAFGLARFWRAFYPTRREFSLEALTHEPGAPGRVFLLDEESVAERLAHLDDVTDGALRWDESTGLRQVYAHRLDAVDEFGLIRRMFGLSPAGGAGDGRAAA